MSDCLLQSSASWAVAETFRLYNGEQRTVEANVEKHERKGTIEALLVESDCW